MEREQMKIDKTTQDLLNAAVMAKHLRIDPPRSEARRKFAITTGCANLTLFGQMIQGDGGSAVIEVYESDVEALFSLVEDATPEQIALARADYESELKLAETGEQSDRHYMPSFEGSFKTMFRRDPKPIIAIEEITDEAPKKTRTRKG